MTNMKTPTVQHPTPNVQSHRSARTSATFIGRWACYLALAASAYAGPRTSANYTITADTVDAGGNRAASTSYTNVGSIGGIVGISTVAAPAEFVRHGYIGQLAAWQTLDDGTFLSVRSNTVTWSVAAGPLTSVNVNGLATAGTVFRNTTATAQGTYLGQTGTLDLTVVNVNIDDYGAYAGDGIDDNWQVRFFGLPPNANAGPLVDPDYDGQNNLFEYTAGLDPTDPASFFSLTIVPVPGQDTRKNLVFSPLVAGRSYVVKFRPDLAAGAWTTLTGTTQSDSGTTRTVNDLNATEFMKYYQVEITKP
jgi:hypothetical protein